MSKIVCFGEVLWDVFPDKKRIGGAPLNVAIRCKSFGNDVALISSVGNDADGESLLSFIKENEINTNEIQINNMYETSHVDITIDKKGSASYTIKQPCAWDFIKFQESSKTLVKQSDVFVFGSLVARSQTSKETLFQLLEFGKFKVFDVNLRPPHYDMEVLNQFMNASDMIKFNDEELSEICSHLGLDSDNIEHQIKFISDQTHTNIICVTKGHKGAVLYINNDFYNCKGYMINVKDTVGAGDSFLATLIHHLQNKFTPQKCIDMACAVGALVASKEGANPKISALEIKNLMAK